MRAARARAPPSSFLPHIGVGDAATRGQRIAGLAKGGGRKPEALAEIERFLDEELERLDASSDVPAEVRLQPHREALDLFIANFCTYAGPLSAIQRAYEAQIGALRAALHRKSHEQDVAQAEYEHMHERITSSLKAQLSEMSKALENA